MTATDLTCLVADDHPALVVAVSAFLEDNGFTIAGPVADGLAAVAAAREHRPPLALLDFRMPALGGAELVREVRAASPGTRILVYTADADEQTALDVLAAGADGVVLKDAPLADLVRALHAVRLGRPYVDPGIARLGFSGAPAPRPLTERELEVLHLLAAGLAHEEIGNRLGIGAETVRTHARKAADRLGARTRTHAVATAIRRGLIE